VTEPERVPPTPPRYAAQLRDIAALTTRYHRRLARSLDLNASSLDAMDFLLREGALTPTEIADRLGISPGAVTSVVRRLEQTGHARRVEHDADRRSVRMIAAEESRQVALARLQPLLAALGERMGQYSEDELRLVSAFLDDVAAAYREGLDALPSSEETPQADPGR
jgi:DNA-binding MarR family transcriptional regulator